MAARQLAVTAAAAGGPRGRRAARAPAGQGRWRARAGGARRRGLLPLLALATLAGALLLPVCGAFKAQDFKRCADAAFCARLRAAGPAAPPPGGGRYSVPPKSVAVAGATLTARLVRKDAPRGDAGLELSLTALKSGAVRLVVDEPGAKRYRVPDVLLPGALAADAAPWAARGVARGAWRGTAGTGAGAAAVELGLSPFRLEVSVGGKPALLLNSRSLFEFEHRRSKTVRRPGGATGRRGQGQEAGERHCAMLRAAARTPTQRTPRACVPACPPARTHPPRTRTRRGGGPRPSSRTPTASPAAPRPSHSTSCSQGRSTCTASPSAQPTWRWARRRGRASPQSRTGKAAAGGARAALCLSHARPRAPRPLKPACRPPRPSFSSRCNPAPT
jgi:hypothetical protein